MPQYLEAAKSDTRAMAGEFLEEMVGNLLNEDGSTSDYYLDYDDGDIYMHERVVDSGSYTLAEADALLDELYMYEETDSGLWEGELPRAALPIQAALTQGNAVSALFKQVVQLINEDDAVKSAVAEVKSIDRHLDGLIDTLTEGEDTREAQEMGQGRRDEAVTALRNAVQTLIDNF